MTNEEKLMDKIVKMDLARFMADKNNEKLLDSLAD